MAERIAIGGARPGKVLARPVLDPAGAEVLSAGHELTPHDITRLRKRAAYVWVETEPAESAEHSPAAIREADRLAERIERMFSGREASARMRLLKRLSLNHVVGRPADDGPGEGGA